MKTLRVRLGALLLLVMVIQLPLFCANQVAKLAPDTVVIHLLNGVGSERVIFYKPASAVILKVIASQASGKASTIPQADITATYESGQDAGVFAVILNVKTLQVVEHGTPYRGVLLVFIQGDNPPDQFPFDVQDDAVSSVESLQSSIDVAAGPWQPVQYRLLIRNNGKISITGLVLSSSNLTDSTTGHRISFENQNLDWGKEPLGPDKERLIEFNLPESIRAGTFVGQLYITANQAKTIAIPFTLRTRGPYGKSILPTLLFCVVLAAGFWISSVLDDWFGGGGLVRAQTYLSLNRSQTILVQRYSEIQEWKSHLPVINPPIGVPHTELWLGQAIDELRIELASVVDIPQDQLISDAQRFVLLAATINLFWSAVDSATSKGGKQPKQLQQDVEKLDNVSLPKSAQDLNAYRTSLLAVIAPPTTVSLGLTPQMIGVSKDWSPEKVKRKIKYMSLFYKVVVWTVVLFVAYQSSYAHNLAFGTIYDYIFQFTWAVGLTQTGTQILTRIHK